MGPDCLRQTSSGRCHLPEGHLSDGIECVGVEVASDLHPAIVELIKRDEAYQHGVDHGRAMAAEAVLRLTEQFPDTRSLLIRAARAARGTEQ